jgi:hypothetical protein
VESVCGGADEVAVEGGVAQENRNEFNANEGQSCEAAACGANVPANHNCLLSFCGAMGVGRECGGAAHGGKARKEAQYYFYPYGRFGHEPGAVHAECPGHGKGWRYVFKLFRN